jgi:hypothetical protein
LGPLEGQKPVNLGISEQRLSDDETPEKLEKSRSAAAEENDEVLRFVREIEDEVELEPEYIKFAEKRNRSLPLLVRDFKFEAFNALRNRVKRRSKPTKQLIVRVKGNISSLNDDIKITSIAGASEVFGQNEDDAALFTKTDEGIPGSERYEAAWADFKRAVEDHKYGAYWCGVIEQAVVGAAKQGTDFDPNLVLISHDGHRYRIIATTVTTYFNSDSDVSLYLIEGLQRRPLGDPVTSNLLNLLTIVCRFKFAFLEGTSPFYWRNFANASASPRELLMELDYLKSEAITANLDQPGAWEQFMDPKELSEMMRVWNEVDDELRKMCNSAIMQRVPFTPAAEVTQQIVIQLERIFKELKPFNTILGIAVSTRLQEIFSQIKEAEPAE